MTDDSDSDDNDAGGIGSLHAIPVALVEPDERWLADRTRALVASGVLQVDGHQTVEDALAALPADAPAVLVAGPLQSTSTHRGLRSLLAQRPHLSVILVVVSPSTEQIRSMIGDGAADVVTAETRADSVVEAVLHLVSRQENQGGSDSGAGRAARRGGPSGGLAVLTAPRGGVGTSTVALNLACLVAARGGATVALVSSDPLFDELGGELGLDPLERVDGRRVMADYGMTPELADRFRTPLPDLGIDVYRVPPPSDPSRTVISDIAVAALESVRALAEVVVVDAVFDLLLRVHVEQGAEVFGIVSDLRRTSLRNVQTAAGYLRPDGRAAGVVLNRVPPEADAVSDADFERVTNLPILTRIPASPGAGDNVVEPAPDDVRPAVLKEPDGPVARALDPLATALLSAVRR